MSEPSGRSDAFQKITDQIISKLESGVAPWVKPWANAGPPTNPITGTIYSGINHALLLMAEIFDGHPLPRWITFRQALELGGYVRKGEHGQTVFYASTYIPKDTLEELKKTGEEENGVAYSVRFLKSYTVFNVTQCEGLPDHLTKVPTVAEVAPRERMAHIDAFVSATGATVEIGGDRCGYSPLLDIILMPHLERFESAEAFSYALLHELGHWTMHFTRLNRPKHLFGSKEYAHEELIAELTAAFLCNHLRIEGKLQHAEYISTWLVLLKEDKRAIFKAAAEAEKAATFLLDLAQKGGFAFTPAAPTVGCA